MGCPIYIYKSEVIQFTLNSPLKLAWTEWKCRRR